MFLGLGLNIVGLRYGGFTPLSLFASGEVGGWYDPSDLTTLFQDSAGTTPVTANSQPVGCMLDKSGHGNHLTQATAAARPIYKTVGGLHWLEGDGVDDWLRATFPIVQPWERVSAIRQITWTSGDHIMGGASANAGVLYQATATPRIQLFDGTAAVFSDAAIIGSNVVVTERHSGATSRLAVNNNAYTTGNTGTNLPGGVTLLAGYNPSTAPDYFSNARSYGLIMREGQMSDAQITQARTYLAAKSGVIL